MNLESCLPEELRGPATTIIRIAAGLSGAGVHRVEAQGQIFVLKTTDEDEPIEGWRSRVQILKLAAEAGLAPRVVHTDESRRAVLSAFVVDRSFPAIYMNPRTRETALTQLGQLIRRVHQLPLPDGAESRDPLEYLATVWSEIADFPIPPFVGEVVQQVLKDPPPPRDRPVVLSHNDVNPSNLVYDGENVLLLDWDVVGPNDPFYDLAAIAIFFRMDEEKLLLAYEGATVTAVPARLGYYRRLVAAVCGVSFLKMTRQGGHGGATGDETLESTASLGEFIKRVVSGSLSPASAEGQWIFGLALIKASAEARDRG